MIDATKIKEVARFARIYLTPEEIPSMARELEAVFGWADQLAELAFEEIPPQEEVLMTLRPDKIVAEASVDEILSNAPKTAHNMFVVPSVL